MNEKIMKIMNKQKDTFLKKTKYSLYQIKYDAIENVTIAINTILDNGNKKMLNNQVFQSSKRN